MSEPDPVTAQSKAEYKSLARQIAQDSIVTDALARLIEQVVEEATAPLRAALRERVTAETSNAMRMRAAIVEARRHLAKGRALWNGPCHQCDSVLEQALSVFNDPSV